MLILGSTLLACKIKLAKNIGFKNISIEVKDSRETLPYTNEEKFNLVSSQIKSIAITVEGINVEPI